MSFDAIEFYPNLDWKSKAKTMPIFPIGPKHHQLVAWE
jgi:hypothetical protein